MSEQELEEVEFIIEIPAETRCQKSSKLIKNGQNAILVKVMHSDISEVEEGQELWLCRKVALKFATDYKVKKLNTVRSTTRQQTSKSDKFGLDRTAPDYEERFLRGDFDKNPNKHKSPVVDVSRGRFKKQRKVFER